MKVKDNNQTTLIPRKLVNGLIPKGQWGLLARLATKAAVKFPKLRNIASKTVNFARKRNYDATYEGVARGLGASKAQARAAVSADKATRAGVKAYLQAKTPALGTRKALVKRGTKAVVPVGAATTSTSANEVLGTIGTLTRKALPLAAVLTVADVADSTMPKNEQGLPRGLAMPQVTKTTPIWKTTPKGTKYLDYGDGTFSLAGSSKRYRYDDYRDNSASQNPKAQGKPAGTRGNGSKGGTRGSGTRGNARTTAKPAATTFTESPTNITDQGWLDARNAAMQRGWGTYNYNGLTYQFTGDELKLAANNWRNRRKAGYQAEGILNLSGVNVPDNLVFDNNYARKIESTVPLTKPVDTKTTPYTFYYQLQIAKNPNLTREALWQATQAVRNDDRDASYYGESSDLVSQLANANQDSAKNYIYNLWNTDNDVATQAGRKNYTESQGLMFGEPTTNNTNKDPLQSWATDFLKRSARQGTKLISRKQ